MKRNWYAAIILLALCVLLFRAGQYVDRTTAGMQRQLEAAYALAEQGDYPAARRAYSRAANRALRSTQVLGLLVRRNILDQLNQTLAVLPPCAEADILPIYLLLEVKFLASLRGNSLTKEIILFRLTKLFRTFAPQKENTRYGKTV